MAVEEQQEVSTKKGLLERIKEFFRKLREMLKLRGHTAIINSINEMENQITQKVEENIDSINEEKVEALEELLMELNDEDFLSKPLEEQQKILEELQKNIDKELQKEIEQVEASSLKESVMDFFEKNKSAFKNCLNEKDFKNFKDNFYKNAEIYYDKNATDEKFYIKYNGRVFETKYSLENNKIIYNTGNYLDSLINVTKDVGVVNKKGEFIFNSNFEKLELDKENFEKQIHQMVCSKYGKEFKEKKELDRIRQQDYSLFFKEYSKPVTVGENVILINTEKNQFAVLNNRTKTRTTLDFNEKNKILFFNDVVEDRDINSKLNKTKPFAIIEKEDKTLKFKIDKIDNEDMQQLFKLEEFSKLLQVVGLSEKTQQKLFDEIYYGKFEKEIKGLNNFIMTENYKQKDGKGILFNQKIDSSETGKTEISFTLENNEKARLIDNCLVVGENSYDLTKNENNVPNDFKEAYDFLSKSYCRYYRIDKPHEQQQDVSVPPPDEKINNFFDFIVDKNNKLENAKKFNMIVDKSKSNKKGLVELKLNIFIDGQKWNFNTKELIKSGETQGYKINEKVTDFGGNKEVERLYNFIKECDNEYFKDYKEKEVQRKNQERRER